MLLTSISAVRHTAKTIISLATDIEAPRTKNLLLYQLIYQKPAEPNSPVVGKQVRRYQDTGPQPRALFRISSPSSHLSSRVYSCNYIIHCYISAAVHASYFQPYKAFP